MKEQHKTLKDLVRKALKNWHLPTVLPPDLYTELLSVQAHSSNGGADLHTTEAKRATINSVLADALDELTQLEKNKPSGSTVLRSRFLDKQTTAQVALQVGENVHTVNRTQATAIEQIASILWAREKSLRDRRVHDLASRLEVSKYDVLIGRDEEHQKLERMLLSDGSDWLIMVVGMGGIGKTALVTTVLRSIIPTFFFHDILQVSVETHPLDRFSGHDSTHTYEIVIANLCAQLSGATPLASVTDQEQLVLQVLKEKRYLIVIDNVEEAGDATLLAEKLGALVMPSKVLIASRVRPKTGKFRAFPLRDLSEADAIALMRHEAANSNLTDTSMDSDETVNSIYKHTGGNPYAIKLLIGMLSIWSLPETIAAIQRGRADRIESLFDHIFKAIWETLSPGSQQVLLSMPLVGMKGATVEKFVELTDLSIDDVLNAIEQLSHQSLLEVRGDINTRSYGVHRLTETFLQQIIYGANPDENAAKDDEA